MITLWQVADPETAMSFDRKNIVGLHHVALKVRDAKALGSLHDKLATTDGVAVEFAPEPLGGGPTRHMMCAIHDRDQPGVRQLSAIYSDPQRSS